MGSLRVLVLIASLAACDTSGIEVVVLMPSGDAIVPDRVRLYVGIQTEHPDRTASIAPKGFANGEQRFGDVWLRDTQNERDVMTVKKGESISFGYLAQADHTELGAIVAIGFSGDTPTSAGSLFHKKTGVGTVFVHEIQLYPLVAGQLEAVVWGPPGEDEACVHLFNNREDRIKEHEHDNTFLILDAEDRDCDGWPDTDPLECTSSAYLGTTSPHVEDLGCAIRTSAPGGLSHCVLGGPSCTDGQDPTANPTQCSPSRYCAPASMCALCDSPSGLDEECIRAPYARTMTMFGIKCHVATQRGMLSATTQLCETVLAVPDSLLVQSSTATCSNAKITSVGQPVHDRLEIDQMRFDVDVKSPCAFELSPRGSVQVNNSAPIFGLVTVDLDNGRSLAVPIQIILDTPELNCGPSLGCVLINGEDATSDRPTACLDSTP